MINIVKPYIKTIKIMTESQQRKIEKLRALQKDPKYACHGFNTQENSELDDEKVKSSKIKKDLQYYLQNMLEIDEDDNYILQGKDGWYVGVHNPYDGEIDEKIKNKIIGVEFYDRGELYPPNDFCLASIMIFHKEGKMALFTLYHVFGMQGGYFFCPDKEPFVYSEIKVYTDMENWSSFFGDCTNWINYGYVTCKKDDKWKLIKVDQFPELGYKVLGDGFSTPEEAMESIGIYNCERYLTERIREF